MSKGIDYSYGRHIFRWEFVGCIRNQQACFTHSPITNDNTLDCLHDVDLRRGDATLLVRSRMSWIEWNCLSQKDSSSMTVQSVLGRNTEALPVFGTKCPAMKRSLASQPNRSITTQVCGHQQWLSLHSSYRSRRFDNPICSFTPQSRTVPLPCTDANCSSSLNKPRGCERNL